MEAKIKVALIYKSTYEAFHPDFFEKSSFDFFMKALKRNPQIEISYFSVDGDYFDTHKLKGKYDIILLANHHPGAIPTILDGIQNLDVPVICRTGDQHYVKRYNTVGFHEKYKIDYYFGSNPKSYFYKFLPHDFMYQEIFIGLEPSLYQNLKPYKERIKDKILNSGSVGKLTIKSRVANAILNPKRSAWYFYKLRTICNKLEYVDHSKMKGNKYPDDGYPTYLSRYRSAIAASTWYPAQKYWEIPAAGCLTFMENSKKNDCSYMGFKDRETVIFINEKNYKDKFEEFLNDSDNPKWEEIANAGRKYVLNNLTNDNATEKLVEVMKKLL